MKAFVFVLLLSSCAYHVDKKAFDSGPSLGHLGFKSLNAQVFEHKCGRCHTGDWVGDYNAAVSGAPEIAARISSSDPGFMMPPAGETPLTAAEKAAVLDWIARGTPLEDPTNEERP